MTDFYGSEIAVWMPPGTLPYVIYHAAWRIYRSDDLKDTSNDS